LQDANQAARWLHLAGNKGNHRAQALLDMMLVEGEGIYKDVPMGLYRLSVANEMAERSTGQRMS
jgi:TPR repeat protein